jgi:hypothetical protein
MQNWVPSSIYPLFKGIRCFLLILVLLPMDKMWSQVRALTSLLIMVPSEWEEIFLKGLAD